MATCTLAFQKTEFGVSCAGRAGNGLSGSGGGTRGEGGAERTGDGAGRTGAGATTVGALGTARLDAIGSGWAAAESAPLGAGATNRELDPFEGGGSELGA